MRYLKIALTGLAIAGVATAGFLKWQSSSSRLESKALSLYLKGESRQAYEELSSLEERLPPAQLLLLQSYTLRESDSIARSSQRLLQGIQLLQEKSRLSRHDRRLMLELGLGLALNGHLSQDSHLFETGLEAARKAESQNPWIYALQALGASDARDFQQAHRLAGKATKRSYLSRWMKRSFESIFNNHWDQLIQARALIEADNTLAARELLSHIPAHQATAQVRLLLGLIQLKEGQKRPVDLALSYFQLAYAYFKELPLTTKGWSADYMEIASAFSQQARACLQSNLFEGLDFFVGALSHWHDRDHLVPLAQAYIGWLANQELSGEPIPPNCANQPQLNALLKSPEWEGVLRQELVTSLYKALDAGHWDAVQHFWTLTSTSTPSNPKLLDQLEQFLEQYIEQQVQKLLVQIQEGARADQLESQLRTLHQVFPFLAQMSQDGAQYQRFLQQLVDKSAVLIEAPQVNLSCDQLFLLLIHSTSAPRPELLLANVRERVNTRFQRARANQDYSTMIALYDLAKYLNVEAIPYYSPEAIANLVADARYLFESNQFSKAQEQLRWVLKLDPQNSPSRLLLGSSYFASGEYLEAIQFLEKASQPTVQMQQMIAICYLRCGEGKKAEQICEQLRSKGAVGDRLLLELGLYLIEQKQWASAIEQLSSIQQKSPDIWIYLLSCSYKLSDSRGVWQAFSQLPPAMRTHPQLAALTLRSVDRLELAGIADTILEQALTERPEKPSLSPALQTFLEKQFEAYELDFSTAAAHYLSESNPHRALALLSSADADNWRVQAEKALALLQLGLAREAQPLLLQELPYDAAHQFYWLVCSKVKRACSEFQQASHLLDQLEKQVGRSEQLSWERIELYRDMGRFDLCLQELATCTLSSASIERQLLALECWVEQRKFEEALQLAHQLSQQDRSAWALWQITTLIYPAQKALGIEPQLPTRNLFELLGAGKKAIILQRLIELGELQRAQAWAEQFAAELQVSFEGKRCLRELALYSQQFATAQALASQLVAYEDRSVAQTMELALSLQLVADESSLLKLVAQHSLNSPAEGERLKACSAILNLAQLQLQQRGALEPALREQVQAIDDRCARQRSEQGPVHFFLFSAQANLLLGQSKLAHADLASCTASYPGLIEANLAQAQLLSLQKSWEAAKVQLLEALRLHPDHPLLEVALAQLLFEQSNPAELPSLRAHLKVALEKAPYLAPAHLLMARVEMKQEHWSAAYEQLILAQKLRPTDRGLLYLLVTVLEQRLREEGEQLTWRLELERLQQKLQQ